MSNWARSDAARCRHNELYWTDANWWGAGPGAHSHVGGVRWWNVKHPAALRRRCWTPGSSPAAGRETLDEAARLTERVMLGVRMRDGLPMTCCRTGAHRPLPQLPDLGPGRHAAAADGRIVLTQRGRLMADAVVRELLG